MKGLRSFSLVFTVFVLGIFLSTQYVAGAPSCPTNVQNVDPATCKHGTVEDWCRNTVCAKGPGEECGGDWNEHGKCGDGMYCACGHCSGCNTNLVCWYGSFC
uniref:Neuroparsin n=1 Tax=Metapenaeus ensis TaxID=32278 RepID=A0A023PY98_METEN|nr:neuroparsin [Metapenaeus ensis]